MISVAALGSEKDAGSAALRGPQSAELEDPCCAKRHAVPDVGGSGVLWWGFLEDWGLRTAKDSPKTAPAAGSQGQ